MILCIKNKIEYFVIKILTKPQTVSELAGLYVSLLV